MKSNTVSNLPMELLNLWTNRQNYIPVINITYKHPTGVHDGRMNQKYKQVQIIMVEPISLRQFMYTPYQRHVKGSFFKIYNY